MSQPYIGEIRLFAGNFAPAGWAFCNGAIVSISENEVLFQLIGTTYGGDGQTTFALPNMNGRVPIHQGNGPGLGAYVIGQSGGVESVTLTAQQIPVHNHLFTVSTNTTSASSPQNNVIGNGTANIYLRDVVTDNMNASSVQISGGSQPHENMMPILCITYIISLYGIFPSPT